MGVRDRDLPSSSNVRQRKSYVEKKEKKKTSGSGPACAEGVRKRGPHLNARGKKVKQKKESVKPLCREKNLSDSRF